MFRWHCIEWLDMEALRGRYPCTPGGRPPLIDQAHSQGGRCLLDQSMQDHRVVVRLSAIDGGCLCLQVRRQVARWFRSLLERTPAELLAVAAPVLVQPMGHPVVLSCPAEWPPLRLQPQSLL